MKKASGVIRAYLPIAVAGLLAVGVGLVWATRRGINSSGFDGTKESPLYQVTLGDALEEFADQGVSLSDQKNLIQQGEFEYTKAGFETHMPEGNRRTSCVVEHQRNTQPDPNNPIKFHPTKDQPEITKCAKTNVRTECIIKTWCQTKWQKTDCRPNPGDKNDPRKHVTTAPDGPTICTEDAQTKCAAQEWCNSETPSYTQYAVENELGHATTRPKAPTLCRKETQTLCPAISWCPLEETVCPLQKDRKKTICPAENTNCPAAKTQCPLKDTECPLHKYTEERRESRVPHPTKEPKDFTKCEKKQTICKLETWCPEKATECPPQQQGQSGGEPQKSQLSGAANVPTVYALSQNEPNPFGNETTIRYQLPKSSHVNLKIIDNAGRVVRRLVEEGKEAGFYAVKWDGKDDQGRIVANGTYHYRLVAEGFEESNKMILLKKD